MAANFVDFDLSQYKDLLVRGTNMLAIRGVNASTGSDMLILPELVARLTRSVPDPNATVYYTNLEVMDACLQAGVHYTDMGGLFHTTLKQLKLHDEMLGGVFSNLAMIRHTGEEFCFDFIANFFPRSVVTSRVYMAAGRIPSLLATMTDSYEQFRRKTGGSAPEI